MTIYGAPSEARGDYEISALTLDGIREVSYLCRMELTAEAGLEAAIDRAVWKRLAIDTAYLNAENADEQAEREQRITDEEVARVTAKYQR